MTLMKHGIGACLLLVMLCSSISLGQTGLGSMKGFVYDENGGPIAGAAITVASPSLIGELSTTSGLAGYYRFVNLPPGRYRMTVSRENYRQTELQNLNVRAGVVSNVNVTLIVGEFSKKVVITWEGSILDASGTSRSLNIDGEFIKRMPLTYDREWDSVWSLVPGVVNEGQYGSFGNRVDVHGAGIFNNAWNLDGMNIGSTFTGANNIYFSPDIIEEVHIVTVGLDASAGGSTGGYINVVTRSGGNEFHGAASLTVQPDEWNWSNVPGGKAAEQKLIMPEFSLGGPIIRDRTWFFASSRYNYRNEAYAYSKSDIERLDRLDLPVPDQPRETRGQLFFGKLTHALSDSVHVNLAFNNDTGHERNADMLPNGSLNSGIDIESGGRFWSAGMENGWTSNLTSTFKFSWYDSGNVIFGMGGYDRPSIVRYSSTTISASTGNLVGAGDIGYYNNRTSAGWGSDTDNRRLEFRGDARLYLERLFGTHDIGFGFATTPVQEANNDAVYTDPYRIWETRNSAGEWIPFYRQEYAELRWPLWRFSQQRFALYLQDTWTINDRITISGGLRAENVRDGIALDITAFSPHFGVNIAVSGDMSDSVRFSWGLRHQALEGRSVVSELSGGNPGNTQYWDNDLDGFWDVTLVTPGTPSRTTTAGNLTFSGYPLRYDDALGLPNSQEIQFGYSRLFPWKIKGDIALVYKVYGDAWVPYNENLIFEDGVFTGLRDPSINARYVYRNNQWSSTHYTSLEATLTRELSDNWQLMASYTWQRSVVKGEWRPDEPYRYLYPASWFESVNDTIRPHVFRVAATWFLPFDISLSGNLLYQSGLTDYFYRMPEGTGVGVPQFLTLPDGRVITHPFWSVPALYQPRNQDREVTMDDLTIVNVGIGKEFDLFGHVAQAQVQAFNLFNGAAHTSRSANNTIVNAAGARLYSPVYSGIQPPRAVQILLKYQF